MATLKLLGIVGVAFLMGCASLTGEESDEDDAPPPPPPARVEEAVKPAGFSTSPGITPPPGD